MQTFKGPELGTYLPKRIYDMNQKTEQLQDLALGLIPGCSNAIKTITKLEEWVFSYIRFILVFFIFSHPFFNFNFPPIFRAGSTHFYVVHENGGLYACSKRRPTKELTKQRLECPEQIEGELAGLRKDFLLNDKCKMFVLVSMATDGMIRLVSMFPEVWFMDTTAGEYEFILNMN